MFVKCLSTLSSFALAQYNGIASTFFLLQNINYYFHHL